MKENRINAEKIIALIKFSSEEPTYVRHLNVLNECKENGCDLPQSTSEYFGSDSISLIDVEDPLRSFIEVERFNEDSRECYSIDTELIRRDAVEIIIYGNKP